MLTGMPIYLAMAIDLPQWALKAIDRIKKGFLWCGRKDDRIKKGFLWCGRKDVRGGHCMVAWGRVCRPFGLNEVGWALRTKWLWLSKTEPRKPWSSLPLQIHEKVKAFFHMAIVAEIGNGASTLFSPRLFATILRRVVSCSKVQDAPLGRKWISDIQGALSVGVIARCTLRDALQSVELRQDLEDKHVFRLATNGKYSAKAGYEGLFFGSTHFDPWERIWQSWHPPKCKFFVWLAALGIGQQIGFKKEGWITLKVARFVIKSLKPLIIFLLVVFLQGNSGSYCLGKLIYTSFPHSQVNITQCNAGERWLIKFRAYCKGG
jgi:hypothetical protein